MKTIVYVTLTASLLGCATPNPPLPESGYKQFAAEIVGVFKCAQSGKLTADDAAVALQGTRSKLNTYSYSEAEMKRITDDASRVWSPSEMWCTNAAITIAAGKRRDTQNANSATEDQGVWWDKPVNNTPRTTICNKIGTQTFCNTY